MTRERATMFIARGLRATIAAGGLLGAAVVAAGDWTLTNSLNANLTFTDNLQLTSSGSSGFITSVRPSVGIRGQGARIKANANYAPQAILRSGGTNESTGLNHRLNADLNATLVRQRLFFSARATAGLVSTSGNAHVGDEGLNPNSGLRQTYSASVEPYYLQRFGSKANLRVGAGVDWVDADQGSDSTGTDLSVRLSSGADFQRFPWSLTATHNEIEYDTRSDSRDRLLGTAGYRINRAWRLDGTLGYQRNDLQTSRGNDDGVEYSGILRWTPNPRASASAELGKRYFGTFWGVDASHRSKRTLLRVEFSRDITNSRSQVIFPGYVTGLDPLTGQLTYSPFPGDVPDFLLDPETGLPLFEVPGLFPLDVEQDFLNTHFGISATVTGRRTTLDVRLALDERKFELSGQEETIKTFVVNASRQLGSGISGHARMSWRDLESQLSTDSRFIDFTLGLSRSLGRHTRLSVDLTRRQREGAGAGDYDENRIGVTLNTRMF